MASKPIVDSIDESRKELLDLSFRNRLLNYRPLRARGVEMVGESAEQVFKTLVNYKKRMSFLADPAKDDNANESGVDSEPPWNNVVVPYKTNQSDSCLQTVDSPSNLQKRLLTTYRLANSTIEETGVNTLFVALGMLQWYDPNHSQEEYKAPLILAPVRLERAGVREQFRVSYTGEDIGANLSFIEKARIDFGLSLPGQDVVDTIGDGKNETITPESYFDQVERSIQGMNRWYVDRNAVALGFFSYAKFLMYRDLDDSTWPEGAGIAENEIIAALFRDGFNEPARVIPGHANLDNHLSPQDTYHVLDADSSQSLAIHDAVHGLNLVIQGPPGTGKSQTITNIIAEAIARAMRVLFVAEKMAALEVVKRRMDNVGLGDACLELHSHKTNKRETLTDLARTLNPRKPIGSGPLGSSNELSRTRCQLNDYAEAVNTSVGGSGMTPYEAFGKLLALGGGETPNPIAWTRLSGIGDWSGPNFRRKREVVEELRLRLQRSGIPHRHPFWGCRLRALLPATSSALREKLDTTISSLRTLVGISGAMADALQSQHPVSATDSDALLSTANFSIDAPDTNGLDLLAPAWESHSRQIQEMMGLGFQWRRMRQGSIEAAKHDLETLSSASGTLADNLQLEHPADITAVEDLLAAAGYSIEAPDVGSLNLTAPEWESRPVQVRELLAQGLRWKRMRQEYDALLLPQAWDTDFGNTRQVLDTDGRRLLRRLFSSTYKRAKRQLAAVLRNERPKGIDQQIALIDHIGTEQQLRAEINSNYPEASLTLGRRWDGHDTDWDAIAPAVQWWLDLLAAATDGRARPGAIRRLQGLKAWPNGKTPHTGLHTTGLSSAIDELNRALDGYRDCAKELQSVLDADNQARFHACPDWAALPFSEQRLLLSDWVERPLIEPQDYAWFNNSSDTYRIKRLFPIDVVAEINGHRSGAALSLGSRWDGHNTDWDSISPGVRWWLDVLSDVAEGHVPPATVYRLQEIQRRVGTVHWQTGSPQSKIDDLGRALNAYRVSIRELQSALDMDDQLRFGDPAGLAALLFSEQREVLEDWSARLVEIQDIIGFNAGADAALAEQLCPVTVVAEEDPNASTSLTSWFERAWYESIVETAFAERPALRDFDGQVHDDRIERFKDFDRQSLNYNLNRVAKAHRRVASRPNELPDRLVRLDSDHEASKIRERQQQLRVLRREIGKRSRHKPIRQLIIEAGDIIQELKPVFMMSPLSIANYLAPGSAEFVLVVFDEASQVRPVDALGALLRAKKAVIVGDLQQLPPSSFFDNLAQSGEEAADENESVTADIESILRLFSTQGAPSRQLRWHYRSRHESLIAVSNQEFYENSLMVFPSPNISRESSGLRFHNLPDAVFDRGRSATNPREAEAVANAVMEHAARNPELSLGVVAFSVRQSQTIQDQLEMLRQQDPSREGFFAAHPEEPFFVKNLENVQGDERDVIFISIGYGRDANEQLSMNFGPLNNQGGERRLNVLITRAKQQCHVFTNLTADDIDLNRSRARGVHALKTFLAYAEKGVLPSDVPYESNFVVDSPFQRAVAERLEGCGYLVHQEVASAGKFIDIAIVDPEQPGRYIIGIECDGASYHSARSARDRDRLREEVLHRLGWKLHRIWSTDWFRNPDRELERAVAAIECAKSR